MKRSLLTAISFLCFYVYLQAQPLHPCAELIWYDEFDGTSLDASKWTPQIGDGCDINLCGWGNNEAQYYTDREENVKVEDGNLVITSLKESYGGKEYTSARIRSLMKGDFTFGRIEARIKLPQGAGSWPAFWMLPTDEVYGSWPQSGEIDIMEYQGKDPNLASGTIHYGDPIPGNKYKSGFYRLPSNGNYFEDFHTFVLEWDSLSLTWYMDGHQYHVIHQADLKPYTWPFNERFHLILNNALGGFLGGTIDDNSFPQTMLVDYVKVYTLPGNYSVQGNQYLFTYATDEHYFIPAVTDAINYTWTVPAGAAIVSGQGTSEIAVDWGGSSSAGDVSVSVEKSCGSIERSLQVFLADDDACSLVFDNMDGTKNIVYEDWNTNTFFPSYNNLSATGINTSSKVGYLLKNTLDSSNTIIIKNVPISAFNSYENGEQLIYMDIYTNAQPGTTVELHLINKEKSLSDYPTSIRSILTAKTTLSRKWQTLVFRFDRIANPSVTIDEVDRMAIVFNPEKTIVNRYFAFDNLRRGKVPYHEISGNSTPEACDISNEIYGVSSNGSTGYNWEVPTGTSINSGQGTEQISVNWGSITAGKVYLRESTASCTDYSASFDVNVVSCPTSIVDGEAIKRLSLYPNPVTDQMTISCPQVFHEPVVLTVLSATGNTVMRKAIDSTVDEFSETVSIASLRPGYYMLQLTTDSGIWTSSFVKY